MSLKRSDFPPTGLVILACFTIALILWVLMTSPKPLTVEQTRAAVEDCRKHDGLPEIVRNRGLQVVVVQCWGFNRE